MDIRILVTLLARVLRICMNLGHSYPTALILTPTDRGSVGLTSLLIDYTQISALTLTRALNDEGSLGTLTSGVLNQ